MCAKSDDETEQCSSGIERLLERVEIRDGWKVKRSGDSVTIDFDAVPINRLNRQSWPGIDIYYTGNMWMLSSYDSIGKGLGIDHAGIVNHGKTIDCQHLDDATEAVENGQKQIELAVGDELDNGHAVAGWPYA